jgi:hypothetical protein
MPILAKQAIQSTAGVEDCEIVATELGVPLTHPISNAVGWQWIRVPMQKSSSWCARNMEYSAVLHDPQSTVASFVF